MEIKDKRKFWRAFLSDVFLATLLWILWAKGYPPDDRTIHNIILVLAILYTLLVIVYGYINWDDRRELFKKD